MISSHIIVFRLLRELRQLVGPILAQVCPLIIIRGGGGSDGECYLALVEQGLDEDVALATLRLVEDELDVAAHGEDFVVLPVLLQLLEVENAGTTVAQFHETRQRHDTHLMTEAHGGLWLAEGYTGVCRLDDVRQQVILTECHDVTGLWGVGIAHVPADIIDTPLVVELVVGEEVEHVVTVVVALHIDNDLEELTHQPFLLDAVVGPAWVVEEHHHEALRVGILIGEGFHALTIHVFTSFLHLAAMRLVEVVLQTLANIIMDAS